MCVRDVCVCVCAHDAGVPEHAQSPSKGHFSSSIPNGIHTNRVCAEVLLYKDPFHPNTLSIVTYRVPASVVELLGENCIMKNSFKVTVPMIQAQTSLAN